MDRDVEKKKLKKMLMGLTSVFSANQYNYDRLKIDAVDRIPKSLKEVVTLHQMFEVE